MSNGNVISEIRSILASDESISNKVRDRLILASISELYDKMDAYKDISQRLSKLEDAMATQLKNREEREKERRFYIRTAWGEAITTVVILSINAFIWFVKILPVLTQINTP